jgi:hypothetical protein
MATETTTYNGWKNRETWCISLWLDNEEPTYRWLHDLVAGPGTDYHKANTLRDMVEGENPLADSASVYSDLLGAALGRVDWLEIIENHKEE